MALRKYQKAWALTKANNKIIAQVSTSNDPKVVSKFALTFIRGLQKEKYLDVAFKRQYPNAELSSTVTYDKGQVTVVLSLNDPITLEDI